MAIALLAYFAGATVCLGAQRVVAERPLMGTKFQVIVEAEISRQLQEAIDAAFAKARRIEAVCSDYREESEVSAISRLGPLENPVQLSPELGRILITAQRIATLTDGAYDPTLGLLTRQWRASLRSGKLAPQQERESALTTSGLMHFVCGLTDDGTHWLFKKSPGMVIDLGGIGKGYAADAMHDVLRDAGFPRCAIIAGGDVRVGEAPQGKPGWKIGLRTMQRDTNDMTITLVNAAVSTSGGLYQTVNIGGTRYSHILDPSTGLGLTRPIAASVIAPTATISDALATAACVTGPERAVKEIHTWGGTAVRVVTEENDESKVTASKSFARHVAD